MPAYRLIILAVSTQAVLAALAVVGGHVLGVPLRFGPVLPGVATGLVMAGVLAGANYSLLRFGRRGWLGRGVWQTFRDVLVPLFGRGSLAASLTIGVAAGVGEELFFRGLLQAVSGWFWASVIFGAAHVGGRQMLALGVWAAMMGMALGALADWSGGLIAPMVAHGVYDGLALEYIRRAVTRPDGRLFDEELGAT